jgi:predicted GIY-YIG superfamily endonuclease
VWFLYIVRCADGSLYVGETNDIEQRLADHNRGRSCAHTAKRRPVELAYFEEHVGRPAALDRERQIKRWSRAKKEALIVGDLVALKSLSSAQ